MRLDDLDEWPQQQVEDYIAIMQAEAAVAREGSQDQTTAARADVTQKAYEAMRAKALGEVSG